MSSKTGDDKVIIAATMNPQTAYQLAQLCRRVTFTTAFEHTEAHLSKDDRTNKAYRMLAGLEAVAAGLRDAGVAPR